MSTQSATSDVLKRLRETIEGEVNHEVSNYEKPNELAKFLSDAGWNHTEADGNVSMRLEKKTPDGRHVSVEFQLVSPYQAEQGEGAGASRGETASKAGPDATVSAGSAQDAQGQEGEGHESGEEGTGEMTDFVVTIKGPQSDAGSVLFYCTTLQQDEKFRYMIGSIKYAPHGADGTDQLAYTGPDFEDLDDSFQETLDDYLSSVGINNSLCDFIDQSAVDKEHREYMGWLRNMKTFFHQ